MSDSTITQMSHPYMTCLLFDRVDDVDASSSVGPNSLLDIILPIYSDFPNDILFLQLEVDSIQDDNENDPTYNPLHRQQYSEQLTNERKVIHILQYITQCFNSWFSLCNFLETLFHVSNGRIHSRNFSDPVGEIRHTSPPRPMTTSEHYI